MAIQTVFVGTTPGDDTGDPARTAFIKINDNFTQAENAASKLVATPAEALAGTADVLPDAEQVRLLIAQDVPAASTTVAGRVEKATNQEALDGVADKFPDADGVHAAIRGLAVGTVSQSGGVPTGAIIERGSNVNGEYVRFADGTQICTGKYSGGLTIAAYGSTGLYVGEYNWTYPAGFISSDVVRSGGGSDQAGAGLASGGITGTATNGGLLYFTRSTTVTGSIIRMVAIGRWF